MSDTYNMFVTTQDANEHSFKTILRPMPGYKKLNDILGTPQGLFRCSRGRQVTGSKPVTYGVWNTKVYLIDTDGTHEIGTIASNERCTFCETTGYGKNAPHLIICDGVNVYAINTTLSVPEQREYLEKHSPILMPYAYPSDTSRRIVPSWVAYLYGYLVVGAKGTDIFYTSYQYPFEDRDETTDEINYDVMMADPESRYGEQTGGFGKWTMSEWQPDNTIVGCSNGSRLFTLGERSFQIFTYQNSKDMPFASPDTASWDIGIRSKESLAQYGDAIFWFGSSNMGSGSIYMMKSDGSPQRISTDEIEETFSRMNCDAVKAFVIRWHSHVFYVISFFADGKTYAYDVNENGWIRLGSKLPNGREGTYKYENAVYDSSGAMLLQTSGALVKATEEKWNEFDGTTILRERTGGAISSDHKPFKIKSIKFLTNNGEYPLMPGKSPLITLSLSKDGSTWESTEVHRLPECGGYGFDTIFKCRGKSKGMLSIKIGCSEPIPFAIYGLDISGTTCKV